MLWHVRENDARLSVFFQNRKPSRETKQGANENGTHSVTKQQRRQLPATEQRIGLLRQPTKRCRNLADRINMVTSADSQTATH